MLTNANGDARSLHPCLSTVLLWSSRTPGTSPFFILRRPLAPLAKENSLVILSSPFKISCLAD